VTITFVLILVAHIRIISLKSIQKNVYTLVIVAIIGFASMENAMRGVLVLPFAVRKPLNVAGRQLKPFGEKGDGELRMGNVLSVPDLKIVPRAIYVTKVHAS